MQKDLKYEQQRAEQLQKGVTNAQKKLSQKPIAFGNAQWVGFGRSLPYTRMPEGYGILSLNNIPNYGYIEKPFGYRFVGNHLPGQFNSDDWFGLVCGEFCSSFSRSQEEDLEEDTGVFKIVKNKITGETQFWTLSQDGLWILTQPYEDYWITQNGNITENVSPQKPYVFKGSQFSYATYKGALYICSGEENLAGSNGKANGLLRWDGQVWDSIDCGKSGFPKNLIKFRNKTAYDANDPKLPPVDPNFRFYDSDADFNPSIVILYKERLLISGDLTNPIQVKLSEWNNPDNFVDNALGIQNTPLTTADGARASSFILPTDCEAITAMQNFNDSVYIATDKGWYIYNLVQQEAGDNLQFQLDSVIANNYSSAGSPSQYATAAFQNRLYFVADYHVIPEISNYELQFGSSNIRPVAAYRKLTNFIDDFMYNVDLTEACIGIYGDKILVGCNYGRTLGEGNNITIVCCPFNLSGKDITWGFTILDYLQPRFFFQNNRGCYFMDYNSGEVYKITPAQFGIQIPNINNEADKPTAPNPISIWQTGWTGYDIAKDSSISEKVLNKLLIYGYFSENTKLRIRLISENGFESESDACGSREWVFEEECLKPDIPQNNEIGELNQVLTPDINYLYRAPYYSFNFQFPVGENYIKYKSLSIIIEVLNSRYFRIENIVGLASQISVDGNCGVIKPKFVEATTL